MNRLLCFLITTGAVCITAPSFASAHIVSQQDTGFPLSVSGKSAPLYISSGDFPGVIRAFRDLQTDIGRVTNAVPDFYSGSIPKANYIVIAGTLGKSPVIDDLVKEGKLDVKGI